MNAIETTLPSPIEAVRLAEMVNHTPFPAQYYPHADAFGEAFHVVVVRLTHTLRNVDPDSREPRPAAEQVPLLTQDVMPDIAAGILDLRESDLAPFKPRCDVLFRNTTAHAPANTKPARFTVGARIGQWEKVIQVTGPRLQQRGLLGWTVSGPQPVSAVRLGWHLAYGGTRSHTEGHGDTRRWADARNPLGLGHAPDEWVRLARPASLPAPQLETPDRAYRGEAGYPAIGLGAIGRAWHPRRALAGTYDDVWKRETWPALPKDHDYRYWNCAPQDQQIAYPAGGEPIRLIGLGVPGQIDFTLPRMRPALRVRLSCGPVLTLPMHLDTLELDLEAATVSCVYRRCVAAGADVRKLELGLWETRHGH